MKKQACVTLDMEPDYGDPEQKIRLLENPEYFERYVSIINEFNAKVTMFTVTRLFESHGDLFLKLSRRIPLEISIHSHTHDPNNACSLDEVRNSKQAYIKFAGNAPLGYRAPIGQITKAGLIHLLDHGFEYDASVYPSIRPGKFGYNNLHLPNTPYRIKRNDGKSLIEFPFTSIEKIRVVFALSYAKLFGWQAYSLMLKAFGLPDIVLLLSHPHDFYFGRIPNNTTTGIEKLALSRNTGREFYIFRNLLNTLKTRRYEFLHVSEILHQTKNLKLQTYKVENWRS